MTLLKDILIPLAAIIASTWTATSSLRNQRRSTADQRYWETRSALYVELLANQDGYFSADLDDVLRNDQLYPGSAEQMAMHRTLNARVDVFASEEVRQLWRESVQADQAIYSWATASASEVLVGEPVELDPGQRVECQQLSGARAAAKEALRCQARVELGKPREMRGIRWRR